MAGFIATCSIVCFLHPKLRSPAGRPIRQAVNSWWPPALTGIAVVALGPMVAALLFTIVSAWTLREYLRLLPAEDRHPVLDALAYAAVPLHYAALWSGNPTLFFGVILLWCYAVLPLASALLRGPTGALDAVPQLQLGIILTVLALSHVVKLLLLPLTTGPAGAAGFAGLLLVCVMGNDAAQYLIGKLFGRHALAPSISPKKTWEGFAGGVLITSIIAAGAAPLVTPFSRALGAGIGAACAAVGLLGDLMISCIKRSAGVKDTGTVLPGQGGLLDRCDSLLITAPLYTYFLILWVR